MSPNKIVGVFKDWLRILTPDWEYTQRTGAVWIVEVTPDWECSELIKPTPRFLRTPPRRIFHPGKPF